MCFTSICHLCLNSLTDPWYSSILLSIMEEFLYKCTCTRYFYSRGTVWKRIQWQRESQAVWSHWISGEWGGPRSPKRSKCWQISNRYRYQTNIRNVYSEISLVHGGSKFMGFGDTAYTWIIDNLWTLKMKKSKCEQISNRYQISHRYKISNRYQICVLWNHHCMWWFCVQGLQG